MDDAIPISTDPGGAVSVDPGCAVGPVQRLVAKRLPLNTFRENVIVLAHDSTALRPERLAGVRKVEVCVAGRSLLASPMICDDPAMVGPGEARLPDPAFRRLGVRSGDIVEVAPARTPRTVDALRAKIFGEALSAADDARIALDLAAHWSDMEIAAFLVVCASFMTPDKTLLLCRGMVATGGQLTWPRELIVDKHCIVWGGRVDVSPADDVLISVERPLGIDTPEQMVASILSKKVAAGLSHLVQPIERRAGPVIVGPDAESAPRVQRIAGDLEAPFLVANKVRRGERSVAVTFDGSALVAGRRAVIVDDICSTGATLLAASGGLRAAGAAAIEIVIVHALSRAGLGGVLRRAGATSAISTDSCGHRSNALHLAPLLAAALASETDR